MIDAEQLVRYAARRVEKLFKQQGQILAMYHFVKADGTHALIPVDPRLTKDQSVALVKEVFKQDGAAAYVFICEIWQLGTDLDRKQAYAAVDRAGGSLEHMPGRTEHVMMMGEDDKGMIQGSMEIHRPAGRKPYLGALLVRRPEDIEGRMVGLLPMRGTKQ